MYLQALSFNVPLLNLDTSLTVLFDVSFSYITNTKYTLLNGVNVLIYKLTKIITKGQHGLFFVTINTVPYSEFDLKLKTFLNG